MVVALTLVDVSGDIWWSGAGNHLLAFRGWGGRWSSAEGFLASTSELLDQVNDSFQVFFSEAIMEGQTGQSITHRLCHRAVSGLAAKAASHVR